MAMNKRIKSYFKLKTLTATMMLATGTAIAAPAPITLTGDYIQIGTNDWGTIGSYGSTSPGILYDGTGTGTFNTSYDYLTPGSPFEGYYVRLTSGSTYNTGANNDGGMGSGLTSSSLTNTSSGSTNSVSWSGSYDPGSGKLFDITNDVSFEDGDQLIKIVTTITAAQDITDLYFLRVTDPDAQAAPGDSSSTTNVRGTTTVAAEQLVYAEALSSKYVIGYYTDATSGVNTGISSGWAQDPTYYYLGNNDGNGDYTIGMSFYDNSLLNGESIVFTYYYVFGTDIVAAVKSISNLSVLTSATTLSNSPAFGAATVIDNTPELLSLFTGAGLTEDSEISEAASETLPLLTGGSVIAVGTSLFSINNIIDSRVAFNTGMSSGEEFLGDKTIWMKPFGAWTDQDDRGGVTGYDAETIGVIFGADGALNEKTRLGVAFAYASANVDGGTDASPQSVDSNVYQLVGYGSHTLNENTEATFRIGYGQNDNRGRRNIAFTSTVASSDYDSETIQLGAGINHSYAYNEDTILKATAAIDYARIKDDAYSETGAGALSLNVESNTHESVILSIGGEMQKQLENNDLFKANLGVGYDLNDSDIVVTAAFAGAPTASFNTTGLDQSPWIADAGLAYVHTTEAGAEVSLKYDLQYREDFLNQSAAVKVSWDF